MTKKQADHIGLHDKDVACYHCGERIQVIPPGGAPITMILAASEAFEKIHRRCPETDQSPTRKIESSPYEWERGLYVGSSSATIFAVLQGRAPHGVERDRIGATPSDPDDFSRCHRLLKVMPEWRGRLGEVAEKFPAWKPLIEDWDRLTAMFDQRDPGMYAFMKTLRGERDGDS